MKTWTFYSLKSAVDKTAAAVNLAFEDASWYLAIEDDQISVKRLLDGKDALDRQVQSGAYDRLRVLSGTHAYRDWDARIHASKQPRKAIERLIEPFSENYSLLILDCPPGIGALAISVLRAADHTVIPVVPTPLSLRALDAVRQHALDKKIGRHGSCLSFPWSTDAAGCTTN